MYIPDLDARLRAFENSAGDERSVIAEDLVKKFEPLIGEAARLTYAEDLCGRKLEWFANARYWFFIYLVEFDRSRLTDVGENVAGIFVAYMMRCLRMRLLWECQREKKRQSRTFLADLSGTGTDDDRARNSRWPAALLRALYEQAIDVESEVVTRMMREVEPAVLATLDGLSERDRIITLSTYYSKRGRAPGKRGSERYGICPSRVNQISTKGSLRIHEAACALAS